MSGTKQVFVMAHEVARSNAVEAVMNAPEGYSVTIQPATRSLEQNALMWPLLQELSNQIVWHGNHLTKEEWKDVLTAALKKQRVVPGVDGGFVVLGQRTSQMSKKDFSELLELIYAFGAEQKVEFGEIAAC